MNRTISGVLELIPARVARAPSGTLFVPEGASCAHPERFLQVTRFLQWLTPLFFLSRDEQRELGLVAGRASDGAGAVDDGDVLESDGSPWDVEERIS